MEQEKRRVTFPEKALIRAIDLETQILEGKNPELLTVLETEGIEINVGNYKCKYQISGDTARIDFFFNDYLLLGYFKGKASSSRDGLIYKGRFFKKSPSNLFRGELRNVRAALLNHGFKFPIEDKRLKLAQTNK